MIYRDGKPVTDRPTAEITKITFEHLDPHHPNHNPFGETVKEGYVVATNFIKSAVSEQAKQSESGKKRGEELRKKATEDAKPIYDAYKQVLTDGVRPRKAIAKTTEELQQTVRYNRITPRQVRRAVVRKKDSS